MPDDTHKSGEHHEPAEGTASAAAANANGGARQALSKAGLDNEGPSIATAALVGVGVAVLEPELIPGILIGAGAVLAPKIIPALGGLLRPLVKGVVKAGYSAAMSVRQVVAEAGEEVEDIVAEAKAEHEAANGAGHAAPEQTKKQRRPNRNPATAL
jgi:hypothetical protein